MNDFSSLGLRALAGVEKMRGKDRNVRNRLSACLFLMRGSYYTGESKWRRLAEEDLRALYRSGVHDHIGGGFFASSDDGEWLRPAFAKRAGDNALLAFLYAEAFESGRMAFYRTAAEEALDWCLRELPTASGLYASGVYAQDDGAARRAFLLKPSQVTEVLGTEAGRPFAECYDITEEGNCGGASIPNLLLNERWNLLPEGYDKLREALRASRSGLSTDGTISLSDNALLLAALAKAARVFQNERFLKAAGALADTLFSIPETASATPAGAAYLFALTELYGACLRQEILPEALRAAEALLPYGRRDERKGDALCDESDDRGLSFAALGFDALFVLTEEERWRLARGSVLRELCLHPERHGPGSLDGLCALLSAGQETRLLVCVTPGDSAPDALLTLTERYSPDLRVLLRTPSGAGPLADAVPFTAEYPIAEKPLLYVRNGGKSGLPVPLG